MKESDFQFTNPSLVSIIFKENKDFVVDDGKGIEIGTSINVSHSFISDNEVVVSLTIKLGTEDSSTPFFLVSEYMANFRWMEGFEKEQIDLLVSQNAPALLLSYARPIISMTTNASHYPAYNIPFINFTK